MIFSLIYCKIFCFSCWFKCSHFLCKTEASHMKIFFLRFISFLRSFSNTSEMICAHFTWFRIKLSCWVYWCLLLLFVRNRGLFFSSIFSSHLHELIPFLKITQANTSSDQCSDVISFSEINFDLNLGWGENFYPKDFFVENPGIFLILFAGRFFVFHKLNIHLFLFHGHTLRLSTWTWPSWGREKTKEYSMLVSCFITFLATWNWSYSPFHSALKSISFSFLLSSSSAFLSFHRKFLFFRCYSARGWARCICIRDERRCLWFFASHRSFSSWFVRRSFLTRRFTFYLRW